MSAICSPIRDLFERVIDEAPEADAYKYAVIHDIGFVARLVVEAVFDPGEVDPVTGNKKLICCGILGDSPPNFGIWVANQYIEPVHQFFGLQGRMTPPSEEARRFWVCKTEWHVFDTEDEVVEAVINCINRRS
jgi:hypothetical protein